MEKHMKEEESVFHIEIKGKYKRIELWAQRSVSSTG